MIKQIEEKEDKEVKEETRKERSFPTNESGSLSNKLAHYGVTHGAGHIPLCGIFFNDTSPLIGMSISIAGAAVQVVDRQQG